MRPEWRAINSDINPIIITCTTRGPFNLKKQPWINFNPSMDK